MNQNLWYIVKTKLAILAATFLIQSKAFAATDSLYDIQYKINTNSVSVIQTVALATVFLIALFAYYKLSNVGKYETFSLKCKKCGSITRGLKCVVCQGRKMTG